MSRELADIQDLKSAFISHCRALGCEDNYIKGCENKFESIETALKALEIIKNKRVDVDLFITIMEDKNQKDKLQAYNFWQKTITIKNKTLLTKTEFDKLTKELL